jgi:hypothetical protein
MLDRGCNGQQTRISPKTVGFRRRWFIQARIDRPTQPMAMRRIPVPRAVISHSDLRKMLPGEFSHLENTCVLQLRSDWTK